MRSKKAIMTSRREFLSNALGIAFVTASTWPMQARSIQGQSDTGTSNTGRTTQNRSLERRGNISAIVSALSCRPARRGTYMTKC
jgi:hypothetical protein